MVQYPDKLKKKKILFITKTRKRLLDFVLSKFRVFVIAFGF